MRSGGGKAVCAFACAIGLSVLGALAPAAGASAGVPGLQPGDIIVADLELNGDGGLIKVDPDSGKQTVLSTNSQPINMGTSEFLDDPYDVTVTRAGSVLAAEEYDAGDVGNGGVIAVNPKTGKQSVLSSNALAVNMGTSEFFLDPWGVIALPGYGIVVGDYNVFGDGALIGVDEVTGKERVFSSNDQPVNMGTSELLDTPARLVARPSGEVAAVTRSADPGIVRVDPDTGKQRVLSANSQAVNLGTSELFESPEGIDVGPDGTLYVTDTSAFTGGGVIGVDPATGKQTKVSANDMPVNSASMLFSGLSGIATDVGGDLVVVDRDNDSVVGVDAQSGAQSLISSNDTPPNTGTSELMDEPYGVTVVPPRCSGRFATAYGAPGAQKLRGGRYSDVIASLGGNDRIKALAGKDHACGGGGKDRLVGGTGDDVLLGGTGRDVCVGGPGEDKARGCEVRRSV